nr:M23 family metallopeptidase [Lachnospiraceae bacterium]
KQNAGMSDIAGRHRKQRYQHDSQYTAVRKYWHGEETGKSDKTRTDVRAERDFETLEDEGRKIKSGIGQRDDRNFEITGLECKKTGNSVKTGMDSSKTGNPSKMGIDGCMTGNSKDFGINNVYSEKTNISSLSDRKASKDYEYRKDYGGIMKYFHSESGFENGRGSKGGIVSKREKIFITGTISRGETLYKSGTTTESRQITRSGTIAKFGTPPKSGPNTETGIHTERPLDNQNASYTKYFNRNNTRRIRSSRKLRKNVEKSAAAIREEDDLIELDRKKRYRKALQKMKIRREYAAAIRKGEEAKQAADYAKKATEKTKSLAQKVIDLVRRHAGLAAIILLFVFMFMFVSTCISSCGSMFGGGSSIVMGGSYESLPNDIDGAESTLSALEAELKDKTYNIMRDYPGYDEYYVYPDYIGHDPFTLVSFLSAEHGIFTASGVQGEVEGLFAEMYDLVLTPTQEIRTRLVTVWSTETDEETGETISVPSTTSEDYTVNVLTARLYRKDLETIVEERLSGNQDAQDLYGAYQVTKGAMQDYYSPLESTWSGSIIKQYGWSKDAAGTSEFHNGIDIAVNPDVDILSAQDGTVTMVTYDDHYGGYVEITGSNGYQSRYGHLQSTNVTVGQSIAHGEVIGKSGHTLPGTACHLHLECIVNGEYYNPVFYFENGQ